MALEIERKFLVKEDLLPPLVDGKKIFQAYLFISEEKSLRIRLLEGTYTLTIKVGPAGISREEYEYTIPAEDGERLMAIGTGHSPLEKVRHLFFADGIKWEVDVFQGGNDGLLLAETELHHADQDVPKPEWIGEEVTSDSRYYNINLYQNPYKIWKR